jgi:hypothetical protein
VGLLEYPGATAKAWIVSVVETVIGPLYCADWVVGVVPSVV